MATLGSIKLVQGSVSSATQAFVDVLGPGLSRPAGTLVGYFLPYSTTGVWMNPPAGSITLTDDAGGRFSIVVASGDATRHKLRHTAVVCDFENANATMALDLPITAKCTIGGVTVTQTFKLKKRLTAIAPTGDQTGNVRTYSTFAEFAALLADPGGNMTIQPAPGVVGGIRKSSYSGDVILKGFNKTIRGTPETFINQRKALLSGDCDNILWENQNFGVGTEAATPTNKKDIDNGEWGSKTTTTGWSKNIALRRGWSIASNDENMRTKYRARRMLFQNRIFCYQFYPANHTKDILHPHCVSVGDKSAHVIADKCIFVGDTRLMQVAIDAMGIVQVNCLSIGWEKIQAAIRFTPSRDSADPKRPIEAIAEGNLLYLLSDTPDYRQGAVELQWVDAANSHVYVPLSGPRVNQFIKHNVFTPDPVTLANVEFSSCIGTPAEVLKAIPNFEYLGIDVWETDTEPKIKALFDHLTNPAVMGTSNLTVDVLAKIRAGTIEKWLSPAQMEGLYGPPNAQGVPWVTGGSMGHGVV